MKVYFDARMIDHPGIGRYMRCLLPLMLEDRSVKLHLLGNRPKIRKFLNMEPDVIDFDYPVYSVQEQLGFLGLKKIIGGDILHVPHYNIPALARFNLIATIHDLIHILYPEGASGRIAPLYMRFMVSRIVRSASGIICVSGSTKNVLEKLFCAKENKISVIYEGIDSVFKKTADPDFLKSIKAKYNLPDKFILYVGSIRRHKNIRTLLASFGAFHEKYPDVGLVIVGRLSQPFDLNRKGVIYLGEIESDADLAGMYNLASALFNLSLYEGFGLTIVEAQACGLPIVCSDIPVHKEVGGPGLLTVNPYNIDLINKSLYNIMFNNDVKRCAVAKGLENINRFDWAISAKKTIELYNKVHDESSDSSRLAHGDAGRGKDTECFL